LLVSQVLSVFGTRTQRFLIPRGAVMRLALTVLVLAGVVSFTVGEEPKPADLAKELAEAAQQAYEGHLRRRAVEPAAPLESIYTWSRRWMEAAQTVDPSKKGRSTAIQAHLDRMKQLETKTAEQRKGGFAAAFEVAQARFYRIEAELWLAEARTK